MAQIWLTDSNFNQYFDIEMNNVPITNQNSVIWVGEGAWYITLTDGRENPEQSIVLKSRRDGMIFNFSPYCWDISGTELLGGVSSTGTLISNTVNEYDDRIYQYELNKNDTVTLNISFTFAMQDSVNLDMSYMFIELIISTVTSSSINVPRFTINNIPTDEAFLHSAENNMLKNNDLCLIQGSNQAVSFLPQSLTESEKEQARLNIGIISNTDIINTSKGGTGNTSYIDTSPSTVKYRASALVTEESDPSVDGAINWILE